MRSVDRKQWESDEAAELAVEAFDKQESWAWQWVTDAAREEYGDDGFDAIVHIVRTAIAWEQKIDDADKARALRLAVSALRELYVGHALQRGLYAAEARDNVDGKIADAQEAQAEAYRLDLEIEADESASIRQAEALHAEIRG